MSINKKATIIINSLTILVSVYKIISFVSKFKAAFFEWWLPLGKIFSYILFYGFTTFFFIPVPFGIYFILIGAIGSFIIFIGE